MYCSMSTICAILLTPDVDEDDIYFGQLVAMVAGLSIAVLGNLTFFLLS